MESTARIDVIVPRYAIMCNDKYPGVALEGYFASTAWLESEEKFNDIIGRSFGWYDFEDKQSYKNDKSQMRMMTIDEYHEHYSKFEEYFS